MNKPVIYLIFCLFSFLLKGQENLVPNGSFEEISDCPIGADLNKAIGWFSPSLGTPDLFNSCADISTNLSVPINGFGYQVAQDGCGYAGFVTFGQGSNYREYIAIKLSKKLIKNYIYKVSFYLNLPENSPIASNHVSPCLLKDYNFYNGSNIITVNYSLINSQIVTDSVDWKRFDFHFVAEGGEEFLIIGNFTNDNQTSTIGIENSGGDQYYFVDNVSVLEIIGSSIENVFTPNNDGLNDVAFKYNELLGFKVNILNRWGEVVNQKNLTEGWNGTNFKNTPLLEGVYFYSIISDKNVALLTGFIQLMR